MKMSLINYVCFLLLFSYIWSSCEDVKSPTKATDCVLSEDDKKDGKAYCCYVKIGSIIGCSLNDEEEYTENLAASRTLKWVYECNVKEEKSCYMNLSIIFALLLFILSI